MSNEQKPSEEQKQGEEQKKDEGQKPAPPRTASDIRTPRRRKPLDEGNPPPPQKFIPVRLPGTSGRDVSDIPDIIDDRETSEELQPGG